MCCLLTELVCIDALRMFVPGYNGGWLHKPSNIILVGCSWLNEPRGKILGRVSSPSSPTKSAPMHANAILRCRSHEALGYVPPLFKNMDLVIHPNLHRNSDSGVGIGRNSNTEKQLDKTHTLWSTTRRKISKIGATRYHILRLKCTKFDFRWGSAPDHARIAYSAP